MIVTTVTLDDGLTIRRPIAIPIRIKPGQSWTEHFDTDPAPVSDGELSGRPLVTYGGSMTFEISRPHVVEEYRRPAGGDDSDGRLMPRVAGAVRSR